MGVGHLKSDSPHGVWEMTKEGRLCFHAGEDATPALVDVARVPMSP
jgi:hypothetical protein